MISSATLLSIALGQDPTQGLDQALNDLLTECPDLAILAVSNGLYYCFMEYCISKLGHLPVGEEGRWASELRKLAAMKRTLSLLSDASDLSSVEYIIIKRSSAVAHVPRDVDIFLNDEEAASFISCLQRFGLSSVHKSGAETSYSAPGFVRIDIYTKMEYLGVEVIPEDFLRQCTVRTSIYDQNHPGLNPVSAYLVNSIHAVFGHGSVSLLDLADFIGTRNRIGDLAPCYIAAERFGWGRVMKRWQAMLLALEVAARQPNRHGRFPARIGRRFLWECASLLKGDDWPLNDQFWYLANIAWDDLIYLSEKNQLWSYGGTSSPLVGAANFLGHRLRLARGDEKFSLR